MYKQNQISFEDKHVTQIYDKIAQQFNIRRNAYLWKGIREFIINLPENSYILDAGCGNGKNMLIRNDCKFFGIDASKEMIKIINGKGLEGKVANITKIPFPDNTFDAVVCVAVLHHIRSFEDKVKAVSEFYRVLKPGGKLFIQVWDNLFERKKKRFIPINNNGEYFVRWQFIDEIHFRYYHLMSDEYFKTIFRKVDGLKMCKFHNEKNNWISILIKIPPLIFV